MDHQKLLLRKSLKSIFGNEHYLNATQKEAVRNICEGKRDVFLRGFGKSLSVHLPVMIKPNSFIIIITSRTAYIKHYHDYFESKHVRTNYLISNTSRKKKEIIENDIISKESYLKILFITPLQYETAYFKNVLKKTDAKRLAYIVIDQAERVISKQENICNQYVNLDLKMVKVPIIAISSVADDEVQEHIIQKFKLLNPKIYAMPVLKNTLICDVRFINIIRNPMAHLTKFIKKFFFLHSPANSKDEESWGLVVCHNLEQAENIVKFLTFEGISALLHPTCLRKNKQSKNAHFENIDITDIKVILVYEKSLVNMIAKKSVRFIIYWQAILSIEKYYSLAIKSQCLYIRYYHNEANDGSSNLSTRSFIRMDCRHKIYSHFFGDMHYKCENYCDVCKEKEKVELRLEQLSQIIHDQSLYEKYVCEPSREKLQQTLPEVSKISNPTCDKTLPCSTSVNIWKEKRINSNLDENLECAQVTDRNQLEKDRKSDAIEKLNNIYKKVFSTQQSCKSITAAPSQKSKYCGKESSSRSDDISNLHTQRSKPIEIITIDDDEIFEKENVDDVIFIEEIHESSKKRRRSATKVSKSFEQTKRRKLS